jgi:hypothetical protein
MLDFGERGEDRGGTGGNTSQGEILLWPNAGRVFPWLEKRALCRRAEGAWV